MPDPFVPADSVSEDCSQQRPGYPVIPTSYRTPDPPTYNTECADHRVSSRVSPPLPREATPMPENSNSPLRKPVRQASQIRPLRIHDGMRKPNTRRGTTARRIRASATSPVEIP